MIDEQKAASVLKLIAALEDYDMQNVYSNSVLAKLTAA